MKLKQLPRYIITVVFVITCLYISFTNKTIIVNPIFKYFDKEYTFEQMRDEIVNNYAQNIDIKYKFIDLNGLYVRLSGGRICNNVVRLKNDSLGIVVKEYKTEHQAQNVIELNDLCEEKGIDFVYVQSPFKTYSDLWPHGLVDYADHNMDTFLTELNGKVPYIDLRPYIADDEDHINKYFYKTDHHWNPIGAFRGFQVISKYLQAQYPNEDIEGDYQNINKWNINEKENWFLGSRGKRTGKYFCGVDDLIWLTPKFKTEMSCANVYRDEFFYGDYYKANIREEYIFEKDFYNLNPYCIYIGGDYPLIQHRNTMAPAHKKVLIVKDSFVLPLQTYFSTVFSEVDVIDMRHYKTGTLSEYIEESNPDIVLMNLSVGSLKEEGYFQPIVSKTNAKVEGNNVCEYDAITIEANAENNYNYVSIYGGIQAGEKYHLTCDSVDVVQGEPSGISIKVYDKTTEKVYDCSMWDIAYCKSDGKFEWTFTAPEGVNDLELLVYAGISGQTNGNTIKLNNVKLMNLSANDADNENMALN